LSAYPYDHVDHRVRSLAAVRPFYDALMPALGYADIRAGRTAVEYYRGAESDQFFGIHEHPAHAPSDTRVAFAAPTRVDVDRIGELLRSINARAIEGPEDCLDYTQPYYAVFFEDPEGNKLEVCCRVEEQRSLNPS
jgi:catechol 2,3-dioxygenase-like lactoylglutathione lyase family enzyme